LNVVQKEGGDKKSCSSTFHEAYWEERYSSTHSLTFALDGVQWSASCPGTH